MYKKDQYGSLFYKNLGDGTCLRVSRSFSGNPCHNEIGIVSDELLKVVGTENSTEFEFMEVYESVNEILQGAVI